MSVQSPFADLDRPVALVTGGAGGIGTALCRALAARGYRVVVADLDLTAARSVADAVDGSAVAVDVGDWEASRAMVDHTLQRYGRLDLVALNAAVNSGQPGSQPLDPRRYLATNRVNVDGVVFGIDAATGALAHRGGAIVVTASLAALVPEVSNAVYALGKAAVVGYVRAIAAHLSARGITINAVCPAFVDTSMLSVNTRAVLTGQGFPLLSPGEVAAAALALADSGGTGEVWAMVAGRPPVRYDFPPVPTTLHADGRAATLSLG
jgi:NAD(P)-dependent dehydrogenase (short-subunit alcohol dehydrogenase family)